MTGTMVAAGQGPARGPATGSGASIFGCSGQVLLPAEAAFFRAADPFGFILFARNIDNPAQVSRLIADLRDAVGRRAPVLIDQEGGRVQRMRAPHWHELPPPLDLAQAQADPDLAVEALVLSASLIAADLTRVGFDANCAPVADIAGPDTHPVLRNRCYGTEPAFVARAARAVADTYLAAGILPVAKHMPGHGRSLIWPHCAPPILRPSAPCAICRWR
jgi:beta-N-acetylhexosaminidase